MQGDRSSMSSQELGKVRLIQLNSKPPLYLDARAWLEVYASAHGEQSPMHMHVASSQTYGQIDKDCLGPPTSGLVHLAVDSFSNTYILLC